MAIEQYIRGNIAILMHWRTIYAPLMLNNDSRQFNYVPMTIMNIHRQCVEVLWNNNVVEITIMLEFIHNFTSRFQIYSIQCWKRVLGCFSISNLIAFRVCTNAETSWNLYNFAVNIQGLLIYFYLQFRS